MVLLFNKFDKFDLIDIMLCRHRLGGAMTAFWK